MYQYELVVLLPSDNDLPTVKKIITDNGGVINEEKSWGEKKLAYKIKKLTTAFYCLFNLSFENKQLISKLRNQLNYNEKIIRYLLLVKEK